MEGYEYLDRRIVKTRDVLKAALMESLQYTQLSQISITDLTTVANINRSTFYSHYTDKYDLLDAAIEQYASIKFRTRQNFETINETILKEIFIDVAIVLQEMKTTYKLNYHVISLIVEKLGDNVSGVEVGDHVLLSFASCGTCESCHTGHPAYCERFMELNMGGKMEDHTHRLHLHDQELSTFFGQSSFGTYAIVNA